MFRTPLSTVPLLLFIGMVFRWEGTQALMWGRMIAERSEAGSIAAAVDSTFSGKAPCSLCHQITRERTNTKTESIASPEPAVSGVWCLPAGVTATNPDLHSQDYILSVFFPTPSPSRTPELPPPRDLQIV